MVQTYTPQGPDIDNTVRDRGVPWWPLVVVCVGVLMIVSDSTAVVLALPNLKEDLALSTAQLGWVVNAFWITHAGFRLLSGRCADTFGHRTMFLFGILIFTAASLGCACAQSIAAMVVMRAIEGVAGAIIVTAALSLLVAIFRQPGERAQALAIYSLASAGGGAAGLVIGGVLTSTWGWRWIFLINVPLGIIVLGVGALLLPADRHGEDRPPMNLTGAVTMTLALLAAIYALGNGGESGWLSPRIVGSISSAVALSVLFFVNQTKVPTAVASFRALRFTNLPTCCAINGLFSAAGTTTVFLSLYLQRVLGYDAFHAGLAFLPSNILMGVFSLGPSASLLNRYGTRAPLSGGLIIAAVGIALLGRATIQGSATGEVLPALVLFGLGTGIALSPLLAGALSNLPRSELGLASGVLGTASSIGRVLGLAALTGASAAHTKELLRAGAPPLVAINDGYHVAFFIGSAAAAGAAVLAFSSLRRL